MGWVKSYYVQGADRETGELVTVRIRAASRQYAEMRANARGILVSRVSERPFHSDGGSPQTLRQMTVGELLSSVARAPAVLLLSGALFVASWFFPVVAISPIKINGFQAVGVSFDIALHAIDLIRAAQEEMERYPTSVQRYALASSRSLPSELSLLETISALWFASAWLLNIVFVVLFVLALVRRAQSVLFPLSLIVTAWAIFCLYDSSEGALNTMYSIGFYGWLASFAVLTYACHLVSTRAD